MTRVKDMHHHYDQLTTRERFAVDNAYRAYERALMDYGIHIANDDRGEVLADAMAQHILSSKEEVEKGGESL